MAEDQEDFAIDAIDFDVTDDEGLQGTSHEHTAGEEMEDSANAGSDDGDSGSGFTKPATPSVEYILTDPALSSEVLDALQKIYLVCRKLVLTGRSIREQSGRKSILRAMCVSEGDDLSPAAEQFLSLSIKLIQMFNKNLSVILAEKTKYADRERDMKAEHDNDKPRSNVNPGEESSRKEVVNRTETNETEETTNEESIKNTTKAGPSNAFLTTAENQEKKHSETLDAAAERKNLTSNPKPLSHSRKIRQRCVRSESEIFVASGLARMMCEVMVEALNALRGRPVKKHRTLSRLILRASSLPVAIKQVLFTLTYICMERVRAVVSVVGDNSELVTRLVFYVIARLKDHVNGTLVEFEDTFLFGCLGLLYHLSINPAVVNLLRKWNTYIYLECYIKGSPSKEMRLASVLLLSVVLTDEEAETYPLDEQAVVSLQDRTWSELSTCSLHSLVSFVNIAKLVKKAVNTFSRNPYNLNIFGESSSARLETDSNL